MIPSGPELRAALAEAGADAWLIFEFHGLNPVARRLLPLSGLNTRRLFVLLPAEGEPVAVAHRIELHPLAGFPGRVIPYSKWEELHAALGTIVAGRRLAMEDLARRTPCPYLDRVPAGVVELIRRLGGTVVPSGALVSRFASRWTSAEAEDHRQAAEILAAVAREELARAVREAGTGLRETALQQRVVAAATARGLAFDTPPIAAFGPNSANPHYEPQPGQDAVLEPDQVVLLDLWAGRRLDTVFADQTWMGFAGRAAAGPGDPGVGDGAPGARRGDRHGAGGGQGGPADRGVRGRPRGPRRDRGGRLRLRRSCTGRGIRSTATSTARARIWTTTRPTTIGSCCPEWVSRWNRGSIWRASSASAAR